MNQEAMKISNSLVLRAIDACTQGNCKALMLSIERLLGVLHVKHLVLSAAEGAEDIWLSKFGFNQISNLQVCCAFYHILINGFVHGQGHCYFSFAEFDYNFFWVGIWVCWFCSSRNSHSMCQ
jgi:hypothetical protein